MIIKKSMFIAVTEWHLMEKAHGVLMMTLLEML